MEKAILVGIDKQKDISIDYYMEELANLAESSNIEILKIITQKINKPTPNYYIGKGKVDEILDDIHNLDANLVIFNDELSPAQIRNLENKLECKVIDRTILILDIFASRAKSTEAILQVELAQLKYMLPRLLGLGKSLSRQQGGIGLKGPGEKKLELDRRIISDQIRKIKYDLQDVVKNRQIQRQKRVKNNIPVVAIVGYTNSGKSTTLNKILENTTQSDKTVVEKDMLFATLETSTRKVTLKNNKTFLLTDTVGFVSKLPHHLIESFKSTLEEIKEASMILHIVDSSNKDYETQIDITNKVLKDLNVDKIPMLYAFNKTDLLENPIVTELEPYFNISAKTGFNIELLIEKIEQTIFSNLHIVDMLIPYQDGSIFSYLKENSNILNQEHKDNGIHIKVELSNQHYNKYTKYIK